MAHSAKAGHGPDDPSPWVRRFAPLVPAGAPVLDLAAGPGRHTALFRARGHPVTAVDRDVGQLGALAGDPGVEAIAADFETDGGWPLAGRAFGGVVATNYLWRPVMPAVVAAVAAGGVLIYETFAEGNERFGRPRNPDFLLRPGELLEVARGLMVVDYEHGLVERPGPAVVQRLCALRAAGDAPRLDGDRP